MSLTISSNRGGALCAAALLLLCNFSLTAQAAGDPPDLSSPQSAATSLYQATDRGDGEAIRAIFHADTDAQRQLADAYAELIVAGKQLAEAARAKYGDVPDAFAAGAVPAEDIPRIEAAEVKYESDDVATLQPAGMLKPMRFRRGEDGKWRLVISDFAGAAPGRIDGQIAMTRDIAAALGAIADEIAAGKHPTVHDAQAALQASISDVMMRALKSNPPATFPSTGPAAAAPATQPRP